MSIFKLVLTFSDESDAEKFFAENKTRLRAAGLDHCTVVEEQMTEHGKHNIRCLLVGDHPEFAADDAYLEWAQATPAPWWTFA